MTNTDTPPAAAPHTVTPDAVADAVTAEVAELYRVGVSRAQAVDSLHSVANELIGPSSPPPPDLPNAVHSPAPTHFVPPLPCSPITTTTPTGGRPTNSSTTTTPLTKPPNPQPLLPPHRHRPPTYRHRRRSTHRASTCPNTCGHPSHRNTPAAPEHRT